MTRCSQTLHISVYFNTNNITPFSQYYHFIWIITHKKLNHILENNFQIKSDNNDIDNTVFRRTTTLESNTN